MAGTEQGIVKGHRDLIDYFKQSGKNVTVSTILFAGCRDIELLYGGQEVQSIKKDIQYKVAPATALFDAVPTAIEYENHRKQSPDNPYPNADVVYVVVTDGGDNSSIKYNFDTLKKAVAEERDRNKDGKGTREFVFINELGMYVNPEQLDGSPIVQLDQKRTQIFVKGNYGLQALFKTIDIAATNVIEDRQITNKFTEQSNKLTIGNVTLGDIRGLIPPLSKTPSKLTQRSLNFISTGDPVADFAIQKAMRNRKSLSKIQVAPLLDTLELSMNDTEREFIMNMKKAISFLRTSPNSPAWVLDFFKQNMTKLKAISPQDLQHRIRLDIWCDDLQKAFDFVTMPSANAANSKTHIVGLLPHIGD